MGKPGPKPVNVKLLEGYAMEWACLLYALRYGQRGSYQRVEWGPFEKVRMGKQVVWVRKPTQLRARAEIIEPGSERQREIENILKHLPKSERDKHLYFPPVMPLREIVDQLERAGRPEQIAEIGRRMKGWAARWSRGASLSTIRKNISEGGLESWTALPVLFCDLSTSEILRAKRLWNYPRTNRPGSGDKRIQFFAKALAGLTLGIAPATATKRLSGWRWPRDWAEKNKRGEEPSLALLGIST